MGKVAAVIFIVCAAVLALRVTVAYVQSRKERENRSDTHEFYEWLPSTEEDERSNEND